MNRYKLKYILRLKIAIYSAWNYGWCVEISDMVIGMFVELPKDVMRTFDYGALVIAACDILSASGVENHINWYDEVEVMVDCKICRPVIDYGRCGIIFVELGVK